MLETTAVSIHDSSYPNPLKEIIDPPPTLFVRGFLSNAPDAAIAVVGSRKHTPYGKQMTEEITGLLVRAGCVIVSGLAFGVDSIAHETALRLGGTTWAVLGSGVDDASITPRAHVGLAHSILRAHGAVLSEYAPGTAASRFTYPKRNRIIAGLARTTIVIEAAEGSGALITAQCALETGRDVFAVPQNITSPNAHGVNELIATGATPIVEPSDVLDYLGLRPIFQPKEIDCPPQASTQTEAVILKLLTAAPRHVDELIQQSGLSQGAIMSTLTLMEMSGTVRRLAGMTYAACRA